MKKYTIRVTETNYYILGPIEAESWEEAVDKGQNLFNDNKEDFIFEGYQDEIDAEEIP